MRDACILDHLCLKTSTSLLIAVVNLMMKSLRVVWTRGDSLKNADVSRIHLLNSAAASICIGRLRLNWLIFLQLKDTKWSISPYVFPLRLNYRLCEDGIRSCQWIDPILHSQRCKPFNQCLLRIIINIFAVWACRCVLSIVTRVAEEGSVF